MLLKEIQGRTYFGYSFHRTRDEAENALENYFAAGEICAAERPDVQRIKTRGNFQHFPWVVLFPAR